MVQRVKLERAKLLGVVALGLVLQAAGIASGSRVNAGVTSGQSYFLQGENGGNISNNVNKTE